MKILLTADWHIKYGQKKIPKDWAENRYKMFFDKVRYLEEDHDLHIISGDIFDRVPTLEESAIYFEFVAGVSIPTIITTGNHESLTKKKSFLKYFEYVTNGLNPLVRVVTDISTGADHGFDDVNFYVVPYECIKLEKTWQELNAWPIFTHVRGNIEPHVKSEIPLEWLDKFPIVFAGDLHSHKDSQRNIVYPGSPMTTTFHRSLTKGVNGAISIDTDDWSWEWIDLELPQLIRKTVSDKHEMVATDYHHTIYELEGTMSSLAGEVDNELLDKKVIKRSSQASLVLDKEMTIEDELKEYLEFVLELPDDEIEQVMAVYNE